jgi:Flp pilus assembly secretin CpaC
MASLAHSPQNDTRKEDLISKTREFGRLEAQGKDALPMLAIIVAEAAADGVISGDKDSDGNDDYVKLYAEYAKARGKKEVHEHTAGGIKANVSKLRQIGIAGAMPTTDFVGTINMMHTKRQELVGLEQKVRPMYAAIVEAARTQIAQPDDLTAEQIEVSIRKPASADPELEDVLGRVEKTLSDIISGEHKGGLRDQSQELIDAHALVKGRLATLFVTRERAELLAKAAAMGMDMVPVTPEVTELAA